MLDSGELAAPGDSLAIRSTRAIVDLDAISANVRALKSAVSASTRLLAVVKGDAYGHGAPMVARTALTSGASALGVATVTEGQALRKHGIDAPILLLGSIDPSEVEDACRARLAITVADERLLSAVQAAARRVHVAPVAVHLKVDTGLRRYGVSPRHALALAGRIRDDERLEFAGISTHFASADEDGDEFTSEQLTEFDRIVDGFTSDGVPVPPRHVANSAAILTGQGVDREWARPGIALYGIPPSDDVPLLPGMRPALRLETRIARIVPILPGDTVGYNRTFRAERPMRGALLPIGYGDGYRRSLAGRSWAGVHGQRAKLLGRVSMDQIVVEVPEGVEAKPDDVVHLISHDRATGAPSAAEMAAMMGTNTYELLIGFRRRIPRVYVRGGEAVAVRTALSDELTVSPPVELA